MNISQLDTGPDLWPWMLLVALGILVVVAALAGGLVLLITTNKTSWRWLSAYAVGALAILMGFGIPITDESNGDTSANRAVLQERWNMPFSDEDALCAVRIAKGDGHSCKVVITNKTNNTEKRFRLVRIEDDLVLLGKNGEWLVVR